MHNWTELNDVTIAFLSLETKVISEPTKVSGVVRHISDGSRETVTYVITEDDCVNEEEEEMDMQYDIEALIEAAEDSFDMEDLHKAERSYNLIADEIGTLRGHLDEFHRDAPYDDGAIVNHYIKMISILEEEKAAQLSVIKNYKERLARKEEALSILDRIKKKGGLYNYHYRKTKELLANYAEVLSREEWIENWHTLVDGTNYEDGHLDKELFALFYPYFSVMSEPLREIIMNMALRIASEIC